MKSFLQHVMLFCTGPIAVFLILAALAPPPAIPLPDTIHTVVIGDSHAQCAVDDSRLPGVANLAAASESYLISHAKLRFLFREHPSIRTVLLDIGYHSLSTATEYQTWGPPSKPMLRRYARLLTFPEMASVVRHHPDAVLSFIRGTLPPRIALRNSPFHPMEWGGFFPKDTDQPLTPETIAWRIWGHFSDGSTPRRLSAFNQYWLERIVRLCRQNGVRLVLLSTPLHRAYRDQVPPFYRTACDDWIRNSGLEIVDLRHLPLPDDAFLPDGDHVNPRGAQIVTEHLAGVLCPPASAP